MGLNIPFFETEAESLPRLRPEGAELGTTGSGGCCTLRLLADRNDRVDGATTGSSDDTFCFLLLLGVEVLPVARFPSTKARNGYIRQDGTQNKIDYSLGESSSELSSDFRWGENK